MAWLLEQELDNEEEQMLTQLRSKRDTEELLGAELHALPLDHTFSWEPMLGLTQLSSYLTLKGSFSAVSKPNFASKYALESSRLHNALLCTVLNAQNFRQKSLKILLIFSPNIAKFDKS